MSRYLCVLPKWLGDLVMSQVLFKTLKHNEPNCIIDVVASSWSSDIVERMPEINKVIINPMLSGKLNLLDTYLLAKNLNNQYDQAFILPLSLKSALLAFLAKIPKRTGWLGEHRYILLNDINKNKKPYPLLIQQYVALADKTKAANINTILKPTLSSSQQQQQQAAKNFDIQENMIAVCPGAAFGSAKRWPHSHYAKLISELLAQDKQVCIFAANSDKMVIDAIMNTVNKTTKSDKLHDFSGKMTLPQVVDCLALAKAVIANDSGLMHVASALNKPTIAIYGPTCPEKTPPLSNNTKVLYSKLSCSPCDARECPLHHHKCMHTITPDNVMHALQQIIP